MLRPFPQEIMEASYKAANEIYAEIAATNVHFKKMLDSLTAFRSDSYQWMQVGGAGLRQLHDAHAHAHLSAICRQDKAPESIPGLLFCVRRTRY